MQISPCAAARALTLLLAVATLPAQAFARPGGARAAAPGVAQPNSFFPRGTGYPRPSSPGFSRPPTLDAGTINRQALLERIANASGRLFDIVPPVPPDRAANSLLPGYRVVRLGRKRNNRLCFAATVAGTRGLIMLDTGASNTSLNAVTYRALLLGGTSRLPAGVPKALSINGRDAPMAEAPDFRVGASNLGAVPVSLIPRSYLQDGNEGEGQLYDGLFGQNILRHYSAIIDCARMLLYLDLDPAKKLDLAASFARHGWTRVPMIDTGSHHLVSCVLNGRRYRLVVDTGAPFTCLDLNLLRDAGVVTHSLPVRQNLLGRDAEPVSFVDLGQLQIGPYLARDVHMIATPQSLAAFAGRENRSTEEPVVGLLGGDLLAHHGAIIDIGNKALYLKPVASDDPSAARDRTAQR